MCKLVYMSSDKCGHFVCIALSLSLSPSLCFHCLFFYPVSRTHNDKPRFVNLLCLTDTHIHATSFVSRYVKSTSAIHYFQE